MELSNLTALVQVTITLLVAALLHELTGVLASRFLFYWSRAWLALAVAHVSAVLSMWWELNFGLGTPVAIVLLVVYCLAEYAFGFLLWVGCRTYRTGEGFANRDLRFFVPFGIAGMVLPVWLPSLSVLFPAHSAFMAIWFLASAISCRRKTSQTPLLLGLRLLRLSLYGLTVLFFHYAILVGCLTYRYPHLRFAHMEFSSLYDAALEVGMAFGMILLATERVRCELEERNQKLAVATDELERAALTDSLTGLLNRRAFDRLSKDPTITHGSIGIIDLNDMKPINDEFGHAIGDVALQLIARSLRIHFRVTDPLFRMGGDEFAVVMPTCPAEEMAHRLGKIEEGLRGQRISRVDQPIDLSISWGVASFDASSPFLAASAKADERMYAQKKKRKGFIRSDSSVVTV